MNIGIFGMGAIGSIVAKYLKQHAQNNYYYFNRSPRDRIQIQFNKEVTYLQIDLSNEIEEELDWLIVCLKEYHYKNAIPKLVKLILPKTKIAIFQNGINLSNHFLSFSDPSNLLETIIDCPCQLIKPQSYLQLKQAKILLPPSPLAAKFKTLFKKELDLKITQKFIVYQWEKLIESSSLGAIQVINKQACSIFKNKIHLNNYLLLVKEGIKVATAEGVKIDENLEARLLKKLLNYPPTKSSSMLTDKLAGNQLELDAKIGAIIKVADKNGINIPHTRSIYHSLLN